jgi:hypothetical protein
VCVEDAHDMGFRIGKGHGARVAAALVDQGGLGTPVRGGRPGRAGAETGTGDATGRGRGHRRARLGRGRGGRDGAWAPALV